MRLYDSLGPNPYTVRLFILERAGLSLDISTIDIVNLENRRPPFTSEVNPRGEMPALKLDSGAVIIEITAICEYLDEVATGSSSLIGGTPQERAETRMWTRRVYLELCHNFVNWWRNGEDAASFYRGYRIPIPSARDTEKLITNQSLNRLDGDLEGRKFVCGERFSMADIVLFGFMNTMLPAVPWLNPPGRLNVAGWFDRISSRPNSTKALKPFPAGTLKLE
jgi:glutathione S-transferase